MLSNCVTLSYDFNVSFIHIIIYFYTAEQIYKYKYSFNLNYIHNLITLL